MFLHSVSITNAFSDQVIQQGATGEDVIELQARLQYNGFFHGQIDGVFGWSTYWALRHFQDEFGMPVDGLAGDQVKDMLERATDYHEDFVRQNLAEGNRFTHYGGMPLEHQVDRGSNTKQQPQSQAPQTQEQAPETQEQPQQPEPETQEQPQQSEPETQEQPQQPEPETQEQPQEQEPETQEQPQQPEPETQEQPQEQAPEAQEQQPENDEAAETMDDSPMEPTSVNIPDGFSQNDIQLMAQAVYGEARGEPYEGQVAVAAVILNRIQSPIFPNTVSGVIFEPLAFTAVADGQFYMEPDETAREAVMDAINGWDPSGEAIYYFNPDTATSSWIWSRPQIKRIGKHVFCM